MYKILLSSLICCLIGSPVFACSCGIVPSFMEHIQSDFFTENNGIVWIGKYVSDEVISEGLHATAYQIEDVLCGSITYEFDIEPDPFMGEPEWLNDYLPTDDLIWVIGGWEASCLETHGTSDMLFATPVVVYGPGYGYSTNLCQIDFLPISSDGSSVSGFIENTEEFVTRNLGELKTEIIELCGEENPTGVSSIESEIVVYPNPVQDELYFSIGDLEQDATVAVYNVSGGLVFHSSLANGKVDLSVLSSGVYIIEVNNGEQHMSKRLLKQ